MTALVDTSAWIEFLLATGSAHHFWVRDAIQREVPLGWTGPILFELMGGGTMLVDAAQAQA